MGARSAHGSNLLEECGGPCLQHLLCCRGMDGCAQGILGCHFALISQNGMSIGNDHRICIRILKHDFADGICIVVIKTVLQHLGYVVCSMQNLPSGIGSYFLRIKNATQHQNENRAYCDKDNDGKLQIHILNERVG